MCKKCIIGGCPDCSVNNYECSKNSTYNDCCDCNELAYGNCPYGEQICDEFENMKLDDYVDNTDDSDVFYSLSALVDLQNEYNQSKTYKYAG